MEIQDIRKQDLSNLLLCVKEDGRGQRLVSDGFIFIKHDGSYGWPANPGVLDDAIARGLVKCESTLTLTDKGMQILEEKELK